MRLISSGQILKYNFIEDYIYGCELKGGYTGDLSDNTLSGFNMFMSILRGRIYCTFGDKEYMLEQGHFVNIPKLGQLSRIRYSSDFHGFAIMANDKLTSDIFLNKPPFPPSLIEKMRGQGKGNYIPLSFKELKILSEDMNNLIGSLGNKNHHFAKELNYALYYILLIDFASALYEKYGDDSSLDHTDNLSRSNLLFRKFLLLVKEHITREGGVAFYADALFISKQYLAMIVKENVGKPISNFLSGARYEIAAQMLRDAKMSIQQVSDAMNFPDQSTFGKFFKRHSGMSPLQYRKSILKNLLINRDTEGE